MEHGSAERAAKRTLDIVVAGAALIVLSPVLLIVAIAARLSLGKPVLFRQLRPGLHGRPFTLYKFRTMVDLNDEQGQPLCDSLRLTGMGRFLRATSLDEIPQLFNVLRGEMSLVGPRPLLMQYLELYTKEQARRHDVRPGITGLAQVNGRNALTWTEKFALDVSYVDRWSLGLDLMILAMTVRQLITRQGISQPGQATAREFTGDCPQ